MILGQKLSSIYFMKIHIPGWGEASVPDDFESWNPDRQKKLLAEITKNPNDSGYKKSQEEKFVKKTKEGVTGIIGLFVIGLIITVIGFLNTVLNG